MTSGYYRFPTIHEDNIVFVSEDDLWQVPASGGIARRLTSNLGEATYPMLSPDGKRLAFVGREEGMPEVYVMPAEGGAVRRLTYLSSDCRVLGWNKDGTQIIFSSAYGATNRGEYFLYQIAADSQTGEAERLPYGPARAIAFGPSGLTVLGRNLGDPARWKRYRGGTAGQLWIDFEGKGEFQRFLAELRGNIASPMWITQNTNHSNGRIYFVSDHEGIGNLYSVLPDGADLRRHTDHEDYYVRNPSSDGKRIVYHAGADLYVYDVATDTAKIVDVTYRSPRVQRNRKFVNPGRFMDSASLNPKGSALAITTRGKAFSFYNHEGAVLQHGQRDGVRYRLADWLNDGKRLVLVSDEPGEEILEIHSRKPGVKPVQVTNGELGRVVDLKVSPTEDRVALSNHRHELLIIDLDTGQSIQVDRSSYGRIAGFDWSPDGRWLVYGYARSHQTTELRLYRLPQPDAEDSSLHEGRVFTISRPVLHDVRPTFDPTGKFIYFISYREFNPVYDSLHFDLGFPRGSRPYLITLQADTPNPFRPAPLEEPEEEKDEDEDEAGDEDEDEAEDEAGDEDEGDNDDGDEYPDDLGTDDDGSDDDGSDDNGLDNDDSAEDELRQARQTALEPNREQEQEKKPDRAAESANKNGVKPVQIDLEGIEQRIIPVPVPEGRYGQVLGIPGKVLFTIFPIRGSLNDKWDDDEKGGLLRAYSFKDFKSETLADGVSWFDLSRNRKKLVYSSGDSLRVITAGEKAPSSGPPRKSGWIELNRVKVSVKPQAEWEQMFREAWRLQRDQFWTEDMSEVDWRRVYDRYFPLISRVSSRSEFSDLMWEMQGELGTSHAYEFGGDYRPRPVYSQGFLGADIRWDKDAGGYRIDSLILGDPWDQRAHSPLAAPGVNIQPGDIIVGVNGQAVSEDLSPAQLLVNQANTEVMLTIRNRAGQKDSVTSATSSAESEQPDETQQSSEETQPDEIESQPAALRTVTVSTLSSEASVRYRAWVEQNRRYVHEATGGRVGYVHIPDMGPRGYAEFHRGYLAEVDKDALIVDVRYNGGGHVSALILEKLARRRLGYDVTRWSGVTPYPVESVGGPLVAITNEYAGSDGDIFSHSFKLMGLGPLIGKRTWGGVIGIWPRHALVDGTVTTQPEFSFWFEDVGWNVENYGTDPDIEVDITPQDYRANRDPQLDRGIAEILRLLKEKPPLPEPDVSQRPSRALPKLPPRPQARTNEQDD